MGELLRRQGRPAPRLVVDPAVTDFYQFTRDSFRLEGYEPLPFDGKIPDVKTVRQVISGNAGLSLNNVVFVSDRGYSDAKNIKDCLRNKLGFLFNVQCEMPGSFAQELIDEERENLRDLNRMDWLTKVFQITKEINWTFEPDLVQGQVSSKKTKESRYFTGTSISID